MFRLREYQEKHVRELKSKIDEFLALESNKVCVFKSPTGSGKTIMMAELIKRLVDSREDGKEIAFIWITVHRLHNQSKEKLERFYQDVGSVECSNFNDLQDRQIRDKEILFFNWQSINQENNIYIRDNENEFNLSTVIANTKNEKREIVLIIDESHHTASSTKSREVIKNINPKVTIEVSATPKMADTDYVQSVDLQEVKEEEMIKKSIMLNYDLAEPQASTTTDELIVKTALEKRWEMKREYEEEGSAINPLVLIQLPDSHNDVRDGRKNEIVEMLDSRFDVTTDNGKLAIYLSDRDNKINLENIEKDDSEVEVLIFKQAIAVGWDCPRASVLVLFREWKRFEFSIQTIGRIMRMPETRHYGNENLNNAYIYTNVGEVKIAEDVAKDYITIYESRRRNDMYEDVDLPSVYIRRMHEKTRLSSKFTGMFHRVAGERNLLNQIDLNPAEPQNEILKDAEIDKLDEVRDVEGETMLVTSSKIEVQDRLNAFVSDCVDEFAPVHSSSRIKRAIYTFFEKNDIIDWNQIQKIVLAPGNKERFMDVINRSKEKYRKEVVGRIEREVEYIPKWNVPLHTTYTKIYNQKNYKKCIMNPAYIKTSVETEMSFMDLLDSPNNNVKWWFKNEVNDKKYFAIKYSELNDRRVHAFYVDFIVRMNDGRIGLFDTKAGITAQIAKPKADALAKYISDNKAKNLFGGIAVFENGEWLYNENREYAYNERDFSDWKPLVLD